MKEAEVSDTVLHDDNDTRKKNALICGIWSTSHVRMLPTQHLSSQQGDIGRPGPGGKAPQ